MGSGAVISTFSDDLYIKIYFRMIIADQALPINPTVNIQVLYSADDNSTSERIVDNFKQIKLFDQRRHDPATGLAQNTNSVPLSSTQINFKSFKLADSITEY